MCWLFLSKTNAYIYIVFIQPLCNFLYVYEISLNVLLRRGKLNSQIHLCFKINLIVKIKLKLKIAFTKEVLCCLFIVFVANLIH